MRKTQGSLSPGKKGTPTETLAHRIAVCVPCYNEKEAIGKVVRDFRKTLPDDAIYVWDNNSTDRTLEEAHQAGAIIRSENRQGKGHVVRRRFADIEAEIYVLVDGDDTYFSKRRRAVIIKFFPNALLTTLSIRKLRGKSTRS